MQLLRIQIPEFRVLKNIDIDFPKDFSPQIFPIGSENGGGKSTLLQLVFTLLHCPFHEERLPYLVNILQSYDFPESDELIKLAGFEILDKEKTVTLEFFCCGDSYIQKNLGKDYSFTAIPELKEIKNSIANLEHKIADLKNAISSKNPLDQLNTMLSYTIKCILTKENAKELIEREIQKQESDLLEMKNIYTIVSQLSEEILKYLQDHDYIFVKEFSPKNEQRKNALLCHAAGLEREEAKSFLKKISDCVFLASPSTQMYLFLDKTQRNAFFNENTDSKSNYYSYLLKAKKSLPGFFMYDFYALKGIIEIFEKMRDLDFREAMEKGEYGNHYKNFQNSLNSLLSSKKITLNYDFSNIICKIYKENKDIEIGTEDLSHGELRCLSIYMWLLFKCSPSHSIVLMDEIEIALHPDWQYKIITDLIEWNPGNQYILGTHSYEVCQALTPRHVKDLYPKLKKDTDGK
ncbi:MAG: ATP-binding protein [Candidatus Brocadiae bacterium]|nr:ATP-binding protein [Candidatus Brocadiia bacterium]